MTEERSFRCWNYCRCKPNEAVKRRANTSTIIADPAFLLPRLLTLLQMLNIPPSGTHNDNITVITSIRSMVVPTWLQFKESHTLSLWAMLDRIL